MKIYKSTPQHLDTGEANPEWLALRAGKFTGSDFHQYINACSKDLSDTAKTALAKKVLESIGESFESFTSSAMARGTELEAIARYEYKCATFNDVEEVAFVDYESDRAGCSPDGVIIHRELIKTSPRTYTCGNVVGIDDECVSEKITKIIEIKCPDIVMYLRNADGYIKPEYMTQMQYNMFITGAKECDFISYYPNMKLVVTTVKADEAIHNQIRSSLKVLNKKYDELLEKIKELKK